jgi:hypothetical protein
MSSENKIQCFECDEAVYELCHECADPSPKCERCEYLEERVYDLEEKINKLRERVRVLSQMVERVRDTTAKPGSSGESVRPREMTT